MGFWRPVWPLSSPPLICEAFKEYVHATWQVQMLLSAACLKEKKEAQYVWERICEWNIYSACVEVIGHVTRMRKGRIKDRCESLKCAEECDNVAVFGNRCEVDETTESKGSISGWRMVMWFFKCWFHCRERKRSCYFWRELSLSAHCSTMAGSLSGVWFIYWSYRYWISLTELCDIFFVVSSTVSICGCLESLFYRCISCHYPRDAGHGGASFSLFELCSSVFSDQTGIVKRWLSVVISADKYVKRIVSYPWVILRFNELR